MIKPCMIGHLFVYKPRSETVLMREYLCDCEQCLALNFDRCNDGNLLEKNAQSDR